MEAKKNGSGNGLGMRLHGSCWWCSVLLHPKIGCRWSI